MCGLIAKLPGVHWRMDKTPVADGGKAAFGQSCATRGPSTGFCPTHAHQWQGDTGDRSTQLPPPPPLARAATSIPARDDEPGQLQRTEGEGREVEPGLFQRVPRRIVRSLDVPSDRSCGRCDEIERWEIGSVAGCIAREELEA
jgi:hypothetical protein